VRKKEGITKVGQEGGTRNKKKRKTQTRSRKPSDYLRELNYSFTKDGEKKIYGGKNFRKTTRSEANGKIGKKERYVQLGPSSIQTAKISEGKNSRREKPYLYHDLGREESDGPKHWGMDTHPVYRTFSK